VLCLFVFVCLFACFFCLFFGLFCCDFFALLYI
jgi:hypothetical protein